MIGADTLYEVRPRRNNAAIWIALLIVGGIIIGRSVVNGGSMVRVLIAIVMMMVLAIPAIEQPRKAILGLFILLPFLGAIRHMFLASTGAARLDPLLLVTSAVAITIFLTLALNDQIDFEGTLLSKLVFFLLLIGIVHAFNPLQGCAIPESCTTSSYSSALLVGLTGIMINLIPISFFFIGRSISDVEFTHKVVKIILWVGALAAAYGLVQVFFGFRAFEQTWLATQGPASAKVGDTTRPFSFFNNAAEYASYLHFAFVGSLAAVLFVPRARRWYMFGLVALIGYSGFLIGSRGFTVKIALALIMLLAARARQHRVLAMAIVVLLVASYVMWSATTSSTDTIQSKEAGQSQLIEQQLRALRDPFNREKSTLPVHFEHASTGIRYAIARVPYGLGTGVTTTAGSKFGGTQAGTELDIGDAFLALGVAGGVLYFMVIIVAVTQASRVRRALPGPVWVGIWVMAATSIGAWLTGGNYAVTPLIWFMLGAADAAYKRLKQRGLIGGTLDAL